MKRTTKVFNIVFCLENSEGYDEAFDEFTEEHSVSMEPGGNAEEAQAEGERFAHFLAEFCDPSWLKGLSDALPTRSSPWCMIWGFAEGKPYYVTSFCTPAIPYGSLLQSEIEEMIKPHLRREFDWVQVIVVGTGISVTGTPHFWCWRLSPRKPSLGLRLGEGANSVEEGST